MPRLLSAFALIIGIAQIGYSDETDKQDKPGWLRFCGDKSADYQMFPRDRPNKPFRRIEEPILLHTQPVRGDQLGAVYLWIQKDSRPVAVGTTILAPNDDGTYYTVEEFHSLHAEPIRGRLGSRAWSSREPGLKWQELPEAPEPKGKLPVLTSQARKLAREFSAYGVDRLSNRQQRPLRFLPNAVYRYEPQEDPKTRAGFIFAGCLATDPEVFLCLESRQTSSGPRWYYAFAGFSDMGIHVKRKQLEVWSDDPPKFGGKHIGYSTSGITLPQEYRDPVGVAR